ncbi:MAG: DUF1015 domain-containing protein [Clostridiales bacterium]|nr:DUF1015 domain-containing protein [Clostridiales bacterium]
MTTIKSANILLPDEKADLFKYSCVACDQFTGDKEYWQQVDNLSKDAFSTYNLTFPEIYLSNDNSQRISLINETMTDYLNKNLFREIKDAMIYIERTLNNKKVRKGIVCACDLEEYEYKKGTKSLIRPTEGTIEDRLPPRVKIRENAPLELPHIMLLVNDPEKLLIEQISKDSLTPLYETVLMQNGGSLKGWLIDKKEQERIFNTLLKTDCKSGENVIRLAVGDGNHSLATAKKCWENLKPTLTEEEKLNHPARYALCEIVNLHDDALDFEPIHRVLYNVNVDEFIKTLNRNFDKNGQKITVITKDNIKDFYISPTHYLTVGSIQNIIDAYLKKNTGVVDYIHEPDQVEKNAKSDNAVGILIPSLDKKDLFPAVLENGALPRKTFSMGMGIDKRYYFEARKIK